MTWEKMEAGKWTLHRLDTPEGGEQRWSIGENGPRAYLTCDEKTALLILHGLVLGDQVMALMELIP